MMKVSYQILPMLLGASLMGCSEPPQPAGETESATKPNTSVSEFVSQLPDTAETLQVATTGNMPPFSFQDEYGNLQGIDIDTIRTIGEDQGFKVEFHKYAWSELFNSVTSGERDLAISGISYRDERAKKYGLSNPYFFNPSAIMYLNPELNIKSLEDLKGLRVGALEGSKQLSQINAMGEASEVVTTATTYLLFTSLVQDEVDAILQDLPLLQYTALNHPDQKVYMVAYEDEDDLAAQQVILMAKSNDELLGRINKGIANIEAKGGFATLKNKWMGATASTPISVSE